VEKTGEAGCARRAGLAREVKFQAALLSVQDVPGEQVDDFERTRSIFAGAGFAQEKRVAVGGGTGADGFACK
jgi:hypothetical protein